MHIEKVWFGLFSLSFLYLLQLKSDDLYSYWLHSIPYY